MPVQKIKGKAVIASDAIKLADHTALRVGDHKVGLLTYTAVNDTATKIKADLDTNNGGSDLSKIRL